MRPWLLLTATLALCPAAHADLCTAQLAYSKGDYERALKDYRELAELGQRVAQYNLAIMYAKGQGVRQSDLNAYARATLAGESGEARGTALADELRPGLAPVFLKAAQSGYRQAQYAVGASLLAGRGCQCEENKALVWLGRAAEADQTNAQVTLAQLALRGTPDAADLRRAKFWLERAAASGDHDGMLYLSALLAAAPVPEFRDPWRALTLLDKVKRELSGDPTEFEIRAAAQAATGSFDQASDSERRAIERVRKLRWDVSALEARLARYQGGQSWFGNLLTL
jgi:TPR repeat protein